MLPGIIPVIPGRNAFTFEFLAAYNTTGGAGTTVTFSGVSFGAEDPQRWMYIAATLENDGNITGMTIDGTAAINGIHGENTQNSDQNADVWFAFKPTGTSGNVVLTLSASSNSVAISVYRVTNVGHPAYDVGGVRGNFGGTSSRNTTVTVPAGGAAIFCFSDNSAASTITWTGTGVTEDSDLADAVGDGRHSAAHTLSSGSITATATSTTNTEQAICGLSIEPGTVPGVPASYIFNGTDEWLSTPIASSSPNRKTFTISLWFRWDVVPGSVADTLLSFEDLSSPSTDFLDFNAADVLADEYFYAVNSDSGSTTMSVRSPDQNFAATTWYHLVWAIDTTQATAANRVKLYMNGTDITETITTQIAQNADTHFMENGYYLAIGGTVDGLQLIDGRVAFVQIVEGAQLAGTDFAEDDAGTWKHKRYTGDFGVNGRYWNGQLGFFDLLRGHLLYTGMSFQAPGTVTETEGMTIPDNLDTSILPPYLTL